MVKSRAGSRCTLSTVQLSPAQTLHQARITSQITFRKHFWIIKFLYLYYSNTCFLSQQQIVMFFEKKKKKKEMGRIGRVLCLVIGCRRQLVAASCGRLGHSARDRRVGRTWWLRSAANGQGRMFIYWFVCFFARVKVTCECVPRYHAGQKRSHTTSFFFIGLACILYTKGFQRSSVLSWPSSCQKCGSKPAQWTAKYIHTSIN